MIRVKPVSTFQFKMPSTTLTVSFGLFISLLYYGFIQHDYDRHQHCFYLLIASVLSVQRDFQKQNGRLDQGSIIDISLEASSVVNKMSI